MTFDCGVNLSLCPTASFIVCERFANFVVVVCEKGKKEPHFALFPRNIDSISSLGASCSVSVFFGETRSAALATLASTRDKVVGHSSFNISQT